jgi:hypothetical protein
LATKEQPIESPVADFWRESDIIYIKFKPTDRHGIDEAHTVVKTHNQLSSGVKTPVLADLREITTGADRKARKYYVGEESAEFKLGMAMLVTSPFQRMLGNIFLSLGNPPYPTKLFGEESEALAWLRSLSNLPDA